MSTQDFEIVTLFPEAVTSFASAGLLGRAAERGLVRVFATNPRDFTDDRHRTVDDTPYGGGPGMVLKAEPIVRSRPSAALRTGCC
jgi:tRNA (guanine37-N1)-methyltransferase